MTERGILKISSELSLPISSVTQTFSILAKRRAGKTYTALVMAEEFAQAKIPFVALDPLGAWWGLRSSADGKSAGFKVVIIGGTHGDVPLEATAGKVIADLVVDHPGFYVVDMSLTQSNAEQDRFACDFAERLYRRKEQKREPLHLFVDEADSFAPQRPVPGQQRMLGAFEAIVRRGGIRGIGVTLITQRPAVLNKNVLTQTECMIVLQMPAPQDQAAVEDWVKGNGTKEQRDKFMSSLASLQRGQAWVWSPSWLEIFKIVNVRRRLTFDSSATPKVGGTIDKVPQEIASVDLAWLTDEIKATVERAKENDPQALKKQITELKKKHEEDLHRLRLDNKVLLNDIDRLKKKQTPALTKAQSVLIANIDEAYERWSNAIESFTAEAKSVHGNLTKLKQSLVNDAQDELLERAQRVPDLSYIKDHFDKPRRIAFPRNQGEVVRGATVSAYDGTMQAQFNGTLPRCEREILRALAQYPQGRTRNQIALLSGYSVVSGGFANALATLRTAGLITRTIPIVITDEGKKHVTDVSPLPTGAELVQIWTAKLPKCEREILNFLIHIFPQGASREDVAVNTQYSVQSGGFANALSKLRTLELITRTNPIKASDDFFQ